VRAAKHEVLELLYACFRKDRARRRRFAEWHAKSSKELRDYALYEALREELGSGGWQSWPAQYQDPSSPSVRKFSEKKKDRVELHAYLQWNARQQLDLVQRRARELARRSACTSTRPGADCAAREVWSTRRVRDRSVDRRTARRVQPARPGLGLPPDAPRALRAAGYRPFVELAAPTCRRAGRCASTT
jgi:hypothetical protein